ncbi:MAG: hypothetical protein WD934_11445 [Gemmatimonadales bacterium]
MPITEKIMIVGGTAVVLWVGAALLASTSYVTRVEHAMRPDCPHDPDSASTPSLALETYNVPEYHDCQKFIVADRDSVLRYTDLFAIYAEFQLSEMVAAMPAVASGIRRGVTRPFVRDSLPAFLAEGAPDSFPAGAGLSFAEIHAWGAYDPLGLDSAGAWCLLMYRKGLGWGARMVARSRLPDQTCRQIVAEPGRYPGRELEVRRDTVTGLADADFPDVARWDWDPTNRQQYIGIRCDGWCEVGDSGFVSSQPHDRGSLPGAAGRVRRVKGWYDEQILAAMNPDGTLRPSGVIATMYPHADLDRYQMSHFAGAWLPVAHVAMDSLLPEYRAAFNFIPAAHPAPLNTIEACHGTRSECLGPLGWFWRAMTFQLPTCKTLGDVAPEDVGMWWGRNRRADGRGGVVYRCVLYREVSHPPGLNVPGTTRWRWKADDEDGWFRCPEGCCEELGWP